MKKIGIVTLGGYYNHGNRLQNAALIYVLRRDLNVEASTIPNWGNFRGVYRVRSFKNLLGFVKNINFQYPLLKARLSAFLSFSDEFSYEDSRRAINSRELTAISNDYDYIIAGSDQVWANRQTPEEIDYFTLGSVPDEKRIAYAASMGNPPLKKESEKIFNKQIRHFSHLSVREQAAADYIERITGLQSPVVLDPTMLLTAQQWRELVKNRQDLFKNKPKYVFCYFLSTPSSKMQAIINDLASRGFTIVNFNSKKESDRNYYKLGPDSFINAVSHSRMVLTDSYHASVFSILFSRPLLVDAGRMGGKMSSRITTLLTNTGLLECQMTDNYTADNYPKPNFELAHRRIEILRNSSLSFLRKAIDC